MSILAVLLAPLVIALASPDDPAVEPPLVVLVAGDEEYRSEETLPMLASILRRDHGFRTRILYSLDDEGRVDPEALENIPGTEALSDADLMSSPTPSALPRVSPSHPRLCEVGATHRRPSNGDPFRYPGDHPRAESLNDDWPQEVLGQRWIRTTVASTRAAVPRQASSRSRVRIR